MGVQHMSSGDENDVERTRTPSWGMRRPTPAMGLATADLGSHTSAGFRQAQARIGEVLGQRYELLSVLGAGSGGSVFRARDSTTRAEVALKLLHEKLKGSAHDRKRFEREVAAASTVHHPNIVRMRARGPEPDGTPYQVLELLDGRALDAAGEDGPLEVAAAVDVTRQLLAALSAVHLHGYVHRDVKPENIFLTRSPDGLLQVKLIDFGVARLLEEPLNGSITDDNMVVGSPSFMGPAQVSNDHPLAPAVGGGSKLRRPHRAAEHREQQTEREDDKQQAAFLELQQGTQGRRHGVRVRGNDGRLDRADATASTLIAGFILYDKIASDWELRAPPRGRGGF